MAIFDGDPILTSVTMIVIIVIATCVFVFRD